VRILSERQGRWLLTLYPPLFFSRVRCAGIGPGFRTCRMVVAKSLLTRNLNGTTFGGTIFSAADPVYALLLWQILAREGLAAQVWLKSARVDYVKPAGSALSLDFSVPDEDAVLARETLLAGERFRKTYRTLATDRSGATCAVIETEVFIRLPRDAQHEVSGF
jgi:acyl-coenzyme A thioesterase PaaI-like protein